MSNPTLAAEDPTIVGARVQARFLDRKQRGDHVPPRVRSAVGTPSAPSAPEPSAEDQVVLLRAQVSAALELHDTRIADLEARVEANAGRATRVIAAAEALAAELHRLSAELPVDVALELDSSIERFAARLRTA